MQKRKCFLSFLACAALSAAVLAACGQEDVVVNHPVQGVVENKTLGAALTCGMTMEEIEAQSLPIFSREEYPDNQVHVAYGTEPKDVAEVDYHNGIAEWIVLNPIGSSWTVDGLGIDCTREEIKAWYGTPTKEYANSISYDYKADGSFITPQVFRELDEGGVELGIDFAVSIYFREDDIAAYFQVMG